MSNASVVRSVAEWTVSKLECGEWVCRAEQLAQPCHPVELLLVAEDTQIALARDCLATGEHESIPGLGRLRELCVSTLLEPGHRFGSLLRPS